MPQYLPIVPQPFYGTGAGQMGPAQNPYGYGQAPGGGYGYYEQQTPVGSFAAANQQIAQGYTAANPYIGQTTQQITGQQSVMPWAQRAADVGQASNPYLGQTSAQAAQTGANPYGGGNPFLGQAIDAASQDATRNFQNAVIPSLDAADRASGSFGNSALQEVRQNAYGDLGRTLGNIAGGMRMQDYTQQQNLAENALNRQQQTNIYNAGLGAGDLSRNLSGYLQGQNVGLQGLGQALGAAQFDASLGNTVNQFNAGLGSSDLSRNAQLAQGLGQFNAGQLSGTSQYNTGQGNALNQYNAGQGNAMLQQQRNLAQGQNQFDQNMDFNTWQANNNLMRQGTQDQLSALGSLLGWNQTGAANATTIQDTPLNYLQRLFGLGTAAGGTGGTSTGTGTNSQDLQGNQFLGGLGGLLAALQLFGGATK